MVAFAGRQITLTWDSVAIEGVRQKGISINGAPIDITDDSDAGWRELLALPGQKEVNLSISGVTKGNKLITDFFAGDTQAAVLITYPDTGTLAGNFHLVSYVDTGPYSDAATYTAELQSTGAITYTPPSA